MRLFSVALLLVLAWSALAFGGVPTWAAAATLVLSFATGLLGFLEQQSRERTPTTARNHRAVMIALLLVLTSIGLQLLPLSSEVAQRLSPARDSTDFEQLLAIADRRIPREVKGADQAPLSIASSRTQIGLAAAGGLAVFLLGASRGFSVIGARGSVMPIAALGVVVTFVGLYQFTVSERLVYGWYVPLFTNGRSAPFMNPNHQAGWLVMVMCLALGGFAGEVARGVRAVAPQWRDRILWLSSKDASKALMLMFATATMAVGILATKARSGALALILSFVIAAFWNIRKQPTLRSRLATGAGLILLGSLVLAYNGGPVLLELAATTGPETRQAIWNDTLRIANDFWLTGSGFNTYGVAMLKYQTGRESSSSFVEAHNDYLQLAAEGGLLVGIPFLILTVVVIREIWARFREQADDTRTYWLRVGAVTGVIAMALQSLVEFTLQTPGGAVMFVTLLAIAIHHPPTFAKATVGKPPRQSVRERDGR